MKNNIKKYREINNITRNELAKKLDISPIVLESWEKFNGCPSIEQAQKISSIFNISIDLLFKDKVNRKNIEQLKKDHKQIVYGVYDSFISMNKQRRKQK